VRFFQRQPVGSILGQDLSDCCVRSKLSEYGALYVYKPLVEWPEYALWADSLVLPFSIKVKCDR
jgi:hypothetical protein